MKNKFISLCYPGHSFNRFEVSEDTTLEDVFAMFNHGSGRECLQFVQARIRSLSVGDFVQIDGNWWQCKSISWEMVKPNFVIDFCCRVGAKLEHQLGSAWGATDSVLRELA